MSQMLVKAGNQHAARLLSLTEQMETADTAPWDPVAVVLRVRPAFFGLFRPADLQAIATQLDHVRKWGGGSSHQVSVAPALADPFAPSDLGGGTEAMQLCDEIANALHPISAYKLPDVCRALDSPAVTATKPWGASAGTCAAGSATTPWTSCASSAPASSSSITGHSYGACCRC